MQEVKVFYHCFILPCEVHRHYFVMFHIRPTLNIPVNVYREGFTQDELESEDYLYGVVSEALESLNVIAERYGVKCVV